MTSEPSQAAAGAIRLPEAGRVIGARSSVLDVEFAGELPVISEVTLNEI